MFTSFFCFSFFRLFFLIFVLFSFLIFPFFSCFLLFLFSNLVSCPFFTSFLFILMCFFFFLLGLEYYVGSCPPSPPPLPSPVPVPVPVPRSRSCPPLHLHLPPHPPPSPPHPTPHLPSLLKHPLSLKHPHSPSPSQAPLLLTWSPPLSSPKHTPPLLLPPTFGPSAGLSAESPKVFVWRRRPVFGRFHTHTLTNLTLLGASNECWVPQTQDPLKKKLNLPFPTLTHKKKIREPDF